MPRTGDPNPRPYRRMVCPTFGVKSIGPAQMPHDPSKPNSAHRSPLLFAYIVTRNKWCSQTSVSLIFSGRILIAFPVLPNLFPPFVPIPPPPHRVEPAYGIPQPTPPS